MDKFDLVFEKALCRITEREYIDSTFEDNISLLVKTLKDNDYLPRERDVEELTKQIVNQPKNVKEIVLDTKDQSLPPIKIHVKQESDSESFSATVINVEDPKQQKEFTNSMLETVFDDVVSYIKTITLKGLEPEAAVEELPKEQNSANQQPGGGESALPQDQGTEQAPNI